MVNLHSPVGRTVDIARAAGYSAQQVRNLERDGVLPPADRTPGGHRVYREAHRRSALAYRALAAGAGPVEAKRILRSVHAGDPGRASALLDEAHARLHTERVDLALAARAAQAISTEPIGDVRGADAMSITELAGALGVRTSTLRHWHATGLVLPGRTPRGARQYSPEQVRDARLVHQLRLAGYPVTQVRKVLPRLRHTPDLRTVLAAREADIVTRSLALLDGAAALADLIQPRSRASAESVGEPGVTV
ncbi:MerR family transcriptional regulator [Nocardia halotolerans]|uniref:MerR family transcriptional regulator n=1 Tax=Nocardia halotolerans TaxID=1755878 RepID=A0ABV8VNU6_9NOCA